MSCQQLTTTISTVLQFAFENDTVRRSSDIVGSGFSFQKERKRHYSTYTTSLLERKKGAEKIYHIIPYAIVVTVVNFLLLLVLLVSSL